MAVTLHSGGSSHANHTDIILCYSFRFYRISALPSRVRFVVHIHGVL
jgi:hypothetical protein